MRPKDACAKQTSLPYIMQPKTYDILGMPSCPKMLATITPTLGATHLCRLAPDISR